MIRLYDWNQLKCNPLGKYTYSIANNQYISVTESQVREYIINANLLSRNIPLVMPPMKPCIYSSANCVHHHGHRHAFNWWCRILFFMFLAVLALTELLNMFVEFPGQMSCPGFLKKPSINLQVAFINSSVHYWSIRFDLKCNIILWNHTITLPLWIMFFMLYPYLHHLLRCFSLLICCSSANDKIWLVYWYLSQIIFNQKKKHFTLI